MFPVLAILLGILTLIIVYLKYAQTYWKRRGINQLEPNFPQGNSKYLTAPNFWVGAETSEFHHAIRKKGWKFAGIYSYSQPILMVVDPELVKDILQKDFQYFTDRGSYVNERDDPLSAHLFAIGGAEWRVLRQKLTPTFTSGKMKMMMDAVLKCSEYLVDALDQKARNNEDINIFDFLARFTTDVIGSAAYGLECNSFKNPDAKFRQMGIKIFERNILEYILTVVAKVTPDFAKAIGIGRTRKEITQFFMGITSNTIDYREKNNISRPDFLQLLIDLKNKSEDNFTVKQIAAQVFLFFVAGFDTSSKGMNFGLYELAKHPDIQDKVRDEINQVLQKYDNKITYESLGEMHYLTQIFNETLRLHTPIPTIQRVCVKEYKIRDTEAIIEPGTPVYISAYGIHKDPGFYENPEKFDPDRFLPERVKERHPLTHIPFGEGPRNCIGLRFGIMQSKIGLIQVLRNFQLSVSPITRSEIRIDDRIFLLKSIDPIYLKAKRL